MPGHMLQAAIIGCGVIAPTHVKALTVDGRVAIRWACDPDPAQHARVPAARATTDWREALADPAVDLVCICTPHAQHAEQLVAALAGGKHVICEKPLATTPADVARMVAAAESAWRDRTLVVAGIFQHRFNPLAARLRQLLADGDFGAVKSASMDFRCTRTAAYYRSGPWRGTWSGEGGALLINQAIHTIDLVSWFCGGEPRAVSAQVERRRLGDTIECEDWAKLRVTFASGAGAELLAANDGVSDWRTDIAVECERGAFALGAGYGLTRLVHPSQVVQAELRAIDRIRDEVVKLPGKAEYGDHHALQIADAVSAIIARRRPRVTLADAAPTVQLVLGAYASAQRGGAEVALPAAGWRTPVLHPTPVPA